VYSALIARRTIRESPLTYNRMMSRRFERRSANVEAMVIGAVLLVLAIGYLVSRFSGHA
jgi:hypothetical protein